MNQTIRIIGGQYRGKKISFSALDGLRPTPDRVRETLFNWLMHHVRGARCLDAFAGSGALGFEAYSRAASYVVLVEQSPVACKHLKKYAEAWHEAPLHVVQARAQDYLRQTLDRFDLIFLDPPFDSDYLIECVECIRQRQLLLDDGLLYIESPQDIELDPAYWTRLHLKHAGAVCYTLYQKIKTC